MERRGLPLTSREPVLSQFTACFCSIHFRIIPLTETRYQEDRRYADWKETAATAREGPLFIRRNEESVTF
jgi:hypothetical protein